MSKFSRQKEMFVDEAGNKVDFSFSKDATKYENTEERYRIPHELWRNNQGGVTQTLYLTAATPGNSTIYGSGAVARGLRASLRKQQKLLKLHMSSLISCASKVYEGEQRKRVGTRVGCFSDAGYMLWLAFVVMVLRALSRLRIRTVSVSRRNVCSSAYECMCLDPRNYTEAMAVALHFDTVRNCGYRKNTDSGEGLKKMIKPQKNQTKFSKWRTELRTAMKVYEIICEADDFQYFEALDEELQSETIVNEDALLRFDGRPKAIIWKPPAVKILKPKLKRGDFFSFTTGAFVVSPEAWEKAAMFLEMAGELLPLPYKGQEFAVLNVTECIDCLDPLETTWSEAGGTRWVRKPAFDPQLFGESSIYKILSKLGVFIVTKPLGIQKPSLRLSWSRKR